MAVNLKIVSQVVASGTPGPAGKSAYQIAVDNGFEGTESEWLKELHPFKGWFDSVSELEEEHSAPSVGEYAYVKGATSSDPVKIYECSTEGSWSDSGRTVDTSTVQTFRSGEAVNDVDITDDSSEIEENSEKIPTSGAVANALGNVKFSTGEKVKNVGIDGEPTAGSNNLVKSGGVYNEISQLGQEVIPEQTAIDGGISYSTGELFQSTNYSAFIVENVGYDLIKVKVGFNNPSDAAAVAFYSSAQIDANSYLGNYSIKASDGINDYTARIPNTCRLLVVSNRKGSLSSPTIITRLTSKTTVGESYKRTSGDQFTDGKGLASSYAEIDSPNHLVTDYISCAVGDEIEVNFGSESDYDFCSVVYDSSKTPVTYFRNNSDTGTRSITIPDSVAYIRCSILKTSSVSDRYVLVNGMQAWCGVRDSVSSLNAFRDTVIKKVSQNEDSIQTLENKEIQISPDQIVTGQGISSTTHELFTSTNYCAFFIRNKGFKRISAELGFSDSTVCAIAFYSTDSVVASGYISSIVGASSITNYSANVPSNCKLVVISNKVAKKTDPKIYVYKSAYPSIQDNCNTLSGDACVEGKGLATNFNEVDSPSHLITDYIPCNGGDNVAVVFGESSDYDFCSVIYDSSKTPINYYRNNGESGMREFIVPEQGKFIRCSILKDSEQLVPSVILNGVSVWNIVRNSVSSLNKFRIDTANCFRRVNDELVELNDTGDITRCEHEKQAILAGLSQKVVDYASMTTPKKFFCLAHITDSHSTPENLKRAIDMLKSEDFSDIDILVHGGDCGFDYKDENEAKHREILNKYVGNKPLLFSMGNHDCAGTIFMGEDTRQDIVDYWFNYLHNADFSGVTIENGKSYYYYDNATYKVRVIVLNDYEWLYEGMQFAFATSGDGSNVCYTQEQIDWFCNTLNSVPEDYTVILAKHTYDNGLTYDSSDWTCPYLRGYTENSTRFHIIRSRDNQKGRIIEDIIHAYISKSSINETYTFDNEVIKAEVEDIVVDADFSSANGTFAFICYGHKHQDGICSDSIYSGIYGVSCAGSGVITAGNDNIGRTPAGKCANLLNLYVLRTDIKKVYVIRIGADFTQDGIKKTYTSFSY